MIRNRSNSKNDILPQALKVFFNRRLCELLGSSLLLSAAYLCISLLSFNHTDPSFNTAVDGPVNNVTGLYGAILSDSLLQYFGLSAYILVFALLAWARIKLGYSSVNNIVLRMLLLLISMITFGVFIASTKININLDGVINSSGVFGVGIYNIIIKYNFMSLQITNLIISVASLLITGIACFYAFGMRPWEYGVVVRKIYKILSFFPSLPKYVYSVIDKVFGQSGASQRQNISSLDKNIPFSSKNSNDRTPKITIPKSSSRIENVMDEEDDDETPVAQSKVSSYPKIFEGLDLNNSDAYQLPSLNLLAEPKAKTLFDVQNTDILNATAEKLSEVLSDFGIRGDIVSVKPGPVVTLYELVPAPGIKSSRIIGLADDIARSMSAISARVAVITGRNAIGIELPNLHRETVFLKELLISKEFDKAISNLPLALGKDISGSSIIADLARMPHLLVAGTTGSGKSVAINSMILSLVYSLPPEKCKLIMVDPKMLELSVYDGIPHLLTPVVTDPKKAVVALKWAVREMENRYKAMSKLGVRNIIGYNMRVQEAKETGELLTKRIQTGFDPNTGSPIYEDQQLNLEHLPYIVVIVDEMADLMLVAGKDIEGAVQRLAQMARAAGIHLIMATQRPSVDVITGTIKANFPTRISFNVTSKIDSRTILGEQGAEQLLGQGDMLFMAPGGRITRVHGPFVTDKEVEHVVKFLKSQGAPNYIDSITEDDDDVFGGMLGGSDEGNNVDDLYGQAVQLVFKEGKASTSFVQRHLQIGYNRAARIIEQMEKEGIISQANHVGKREVLLKASGE